MSEPANSFEYHREMGYTDPQWRQENPGLATLLDSWREAVPADAKTPLAILATGDSLTVTLDTRQGKEPTAVMEIQDGIGGYQMRYFYDDAHSRKLPPVLTEAAATAALVKLNETMCLTGYPLPPKKENWFTRNIYADAPFVSLDGELVSDMMRAARNTLEDGPERVAPVAVEPEFEFEGLPVYDCRMAPEALAAMQEEAGRHINVRAVEPVLVTVEALGGQRMLILTEGAQIARGPGLWATLSAGAPFKDLAQHRPETIEMAPPELVEAFEAPTAAAHL